MCSGKGDNDDEDDDDKGKSGKARARVALARATMMQADKDDSKVRVALGRVMSDDDDDNDDNNDDGKRARKVILVSVAMMTARAREVSIGDNDDEKDPLTHFLSFALHRFMVSLCSGMGDDDGKGGRVVLVSVAMMTARAREVSSYW